MGRRGRDRRNLAHVKEDFGSKISKEEMVKVQHMKYLIELNQISNEVIEFLAKRKELNPLEMRIVLHEALALNEVLVDLAYEELDELCEGEGEDDEGAEGEGHD